MSSRVSRPRSHAARARRQRLVAGAVLATTGLLGTYLTALRPQPTYAAPLGGASDLGAPIRPLVFPAYCPGDTTNVAADDTDLQTAIVTSTDDSVICITESMTLSQTLEIDDTSVTIIGRDDSAVSLDGAGTRRILVVSLDDTVDDTVTLANLTLANGRTTSFFQSGGVAAIGKDGGSDALVLRNVELIQNFSAVGGGMLVEDMALVDIAYSSLSGNTAQYYGGAIYSTSSSLRISHSSFTGNTANANAGGAISALNASEVHLTNSFFGGNYAPQTAGSIFATTGSDVSLVFSTLYDDSTGTSGNAESIYLSNSTLTSTASTVGSSIDDTVIVLTLGASVDDSYSVSTGPQVFTDPTSQTVASGSLQMGALDGTGFGRVGRSPASSSVLVTAAPLSTTFSAITADQLGNARPSPGGLQSTIGARQVAGGSTPPTPPAPVYPPSAPREVTADPGDGEVTVAWKPPANPGSFPVTNYRVTAQPGKDTCLVAVPDTSCVVRGLTNGQSYTFTVDALNGAGWGAKSSPTDPVTPTRRVVSLTLDQGTRSKDGRHDRIRTGGSSVGVPEGARLTPLIRYSNRNTFQQGKATIIVSSDGSFTWTRKIKTGRGLTAYVMWEDVDSNRVYWAKVS